MLKKLSALLALVLCAQVPACQSRVSNYTHVKNVSGDGTTEGVVFISNEFNQKERKAIEEAIETWNYVLNGYHRFVVQKSNIPVNDEQSYMSFISGGFTVQKVWAGNEDYITKDDITGERIKILAWVDKVGGSRVWVVKNRVVTEDVYYIMLHEIGHVLGARHVGRQSLMSPLYERLSYSCVDLESVKQVAARVRAPIEELNHCYSSSHSEK